MSCAPECFCHYLSTHNPQPHPLVLCHFLENNNFCKLIVHIFPFMPYRICMFISIIVSFIKNNFLVFVLLCIFQQWSHVILLYTTLMRLSVLCSSFGTGSNRSHHVLWMNTLYPCLSKNGSLCVCTPRVYVHVCR